MGYFVRLLIFNFVRQIVIADCFQIEISKKKRSVHFGKITIVLILFVLNL